MMHDRRHRVLAAAAVLVLIGSGCALLGVEKQRKRAEILGRIRGSARVEPADDDSIVVVLGRAAGDGSEIDAETGRPAGNIIDHYRLTKDGTFVFLVSPGTFRLAAFADQNSNLTYDVGEPALVDQPLFEIGPGETLDRIELVIPRESTLDQRYDIIALQARTPNDQENFSLGRFTVKGDVVDLHDPKFGSASGEMGLWRFTDFLFEVGPGVYFLEEFDPKKIPVLFVHGMSGYPQEFSTLIGNLDRKRFQPWFYFYPSGFRLEGIARHLTSVIAELQIQHGFDELAVVAHSMGGLVSRDFILQHFQKTGRRFVRLFVAISSPWGGSAFAAGVESAPAGLVIYSWLDMNPESDFLKSLFYFPPDYRRSRPLPDHVPFHMLFGYRRNERSMGPSGDGTLTLKSEARIEAVEEARSILPLDYGHREILESSEASTRLNTILSETFDEPGAKLD
jgi:pimeloyl-ACP methyl ester carboxylesterase